MLPVPEAVPGADILNLDGPLQRENGGTCTASERTSEKSGRSSYQVDSSFTLHVVYYVRKMNRLLQKC